MATTIDEAVKRLRIEASDTGLAQTAAKARDLAAAEDAVAQAAQRQEKATAAAEAPLAAIQRRYEDGVKAQQAYAAANDNLTRNAQAAGQGFIGAAEQTLQFAGHLKLAAAAAYIAIPAFRGLVNPAIVAGLQQTGAAIAAVSPAAVSAGGAIVTALTPALGFLARLAIPALAIASVYEFADAVTKLGEKQRVALGDLAKNAEKAGVGVELFQRLQLAAKAVGAPLDSAAEAMKKFSDAINAGGTGGAFNDKLKELIAAGNKIDTAEINRAGTVEEKYRAATALISDMLEKGQRVAALDLAKTFLPAALLDRLRASGDALQQIQQAADHVAQDKIFSAQDVAYAIDLTNRMKEAQDILAQKWLPIQKDLTRLGLEYQETWILVLRTMAGAVEKGQELYKWLSGGASIVEGMASLLTKIASTSILGPAAGPLAEQLFRAGSRSLNPPPGDRTAANIPDDARSQLTAGLIQPSAVQKAMQLSSEIQSAIRGDTTKKQAEDVKTLANSYDLLVQRLEGRVEEMQLEINLQDRDKESVTKLKTEHELERAARKAGLDVGKEEIAQLATLYAAKERELAQARLIGDVNFERSQLGRTDTEAAIAQRLRGAGLPVDLDSKAAQMMRLNDQLKTAKDLSTEFALSFTRDIRNGVNALTALQNALNKVLDLLIEMAVKAAVAKSVGAVGGLDFGRLFSGQSQYGGGGVGDQGPTPFMAGQQLHSGGIAGMGGVQRFVHPAYFENAPRYHMGVDEVPAILQRGETVLPRGASSRAPVINLNITNNAGADVQSGEARQNSDGTFDLNILIERKVNKAIASGAADRALGTRHGATPRVIAR